ncbi:immunoglobulin lambda-1 light chain-like isoform X1 [Sphaeramia orbicularis]|uniref:immunoglobulin lambda-1 light chain-like isoform X1 n=1 Tax=Sphaeramia orbicularis TaxID=375764 RepID=UPI00117EFD1A|nr:immunoglobulin lambda-1 light chain-like isoform X1 [Sphaeramia orbicularis]
MLLLLPAALCCLCSALVTTATQLTQDKLFLSKGVEKSVSMSCGGTEQCDEKKLYWFQKKDGQPFQIILRYNLENEQPNNRFNHPDKDDFSVWKTDSGCELRIATTKAAHSATYYCACYKEVPGGSGGSNKYMIFGSGTHLYITNDRVKKPTVGVYPLASSAHPEGRGSLLCVASDMSPPLVRFSWKRQKEGGAVEELPDAEGEQLEVRAGGHVATIRVVDRDPVHSYKYWCSVQHEGKTEDAPEQQEVAAGGRPGPHVRPWDQERLLCLMYTVLMGKSLVYSCGLGLINLTRPRTVHRP